MPNINPLTQPKIKPRVLLDGTPTVKRNLVHTSFTLNT